jgi:hypothetical protein
MSTTDVRTLLKNAALKIEELEGKLRESEASRSAPIGLIGAGCRFPDEEPECHAFRISSHDGALPWTVHAEGRLRVGARGPAPRCERPEAIRARCSTPTRPR